MIINKTYFKNEIYIPHAKPSVSANVISVSSSLDGFIEQYERDCLIKCLGFPLYKEFSAQLDSTKPNGLIDGSDEKWNDLLNGKEYTDLDGLDTEWSGIRYESVKDGGYNMSFLAYYVYFFYEQNNDTARSSIGHQRGKAKNAERVSGNDKLTKAWRHFYEIVQDGSCDPLIYMKPGFALGIDWTGSNGPKTLYQFINDMNELESDTYPNFKPKRWDNINNFGI